MATTMATARTAQPLPLLTLPLRRMLVLDGEARVVSGARILLVFRLLFGVESKCTDRSILTGHRCFEVSSVDTGRGSLISAMTVEDNSYIDRLILVHRRIILLFRASGDPRFPLVTAGCGLYCISGFAGYKRAHILRFIRLIWRCC